MNQTLRRFYHLSRPILVKVGPNSRLTRRWIEFFINRLCKEFGTSVAFTSDALEINKGKYLMRLNRSHWVYGVALSKDFDKYFNCVVPKALGDRVVVDYSTPSLHRFRNSGLEFEVASFPEEEDAVSSYFRWYQPRSGEIVFDFGANCGLSAYLLSSYVGPTGKVYAFEPDPINYGTLVRNVDRHRLSNVIALRKAIAAESGTLEFLSEGTIGSVLARQSNRPTTGTVVAVEALSLDDACRSFSIPQYIKMDVEGAEVEIIAASRAFLREHPIHLAIDTNHFKNGRLTCHAVEQLLEECGYEVMSSDESGFMTTWARKR